MAKGTVNKVILLGRLGQDPEIRQTQTTTVATMSLATNDGMGDNIVTEWHRVVIFGKAAEVIQKYATKGSQLYIEGRIRTNKWQDDAGNNKYSTEIIANNFQFVNGGSQDGSRPTPNFNDASEPQQASNPVNNDYGEAKGKPAQNNMPDFNNLNNDFDDDIPF